MPKAKYEILSFGGTSSKGSFITGTHECQSPRDVELRLGCLNKTPARQRMQEPSFKFFKLVLFPPSCGKQFMDIKHTAGKEIRALGKLAGATRRLSWRMIILEINRRQIVH